MFECCHSYDCVMSHMWLSVATHIACVVSHMCLSVATHMNKSHEIYEWVQGGVESQGALSLQVIFRKRALYLVALLQKMTCNLRHPMSLRHPLIEGAVWHTWMPHIWLRDATHVFECCHTYECVTWHIWMSNVTHMNESRHTWMPHIRLRDVTHMCHVSHMDESRHTYERVLSYMWMRHVTHMNESRHTYDCVMSHICVMSLTWMSHVTLMNASCHILECITPHTFLSVMPHMRLRDVTHMIECCCTYE